MKKLISLGLSLTIMLNTAAKISFSAAAESESRKEYVHNGYTVTYTTVSEWAGNHNISVTLENTGEEEICGWAVKYESEGMISGLWNGRLYYNEDELHVIVSENYNSIIAPKSSITFGYTLSGESFELPEDMVLCNEWKEAEETVEASFEILEDWGSTYQAQVLISNNTENEINCWKLGFAFTGEISEIWDAVLLSEEDGRAVVRNNETNGIIPPQGKVSFSFTAKKGEEETPAISDFILYENYIDTGSIAEEVVPEIMGYADFSENILSVKWCSTVNDGIFKVLMSEDGESFEEIAELENAAGYEYGAIDFEKAYFKIVQTTADGKTAESAVIAVEYENGEPNWEYIDTDGDGIPDVYEEELGTDTSNHDTDGDGLTDYEEIYLTSTDPLVYNSINEEISDAEADSDGDGVSNRTEIDNGTNPLLPDSDYDAINDGEEAELGTDPVNGDTDGDGISDGDELTLNLDPTSDTTDGIKDSERTTKQKIEADSEVMEEINTDENPMKVSIELEAAGLAESSLGVAESGYAGALSNSAIVGGIPEFSYPEGLSTGEITVKFAVDESVKANTVGDYAEDCEELQGIKRFNVFKYFEDTNMLLPIETFHDEEQGIVYTKTDCLGTYCVMDLEIWMKNLGVEADEATETVDISYLSAEETEEEKLNVVFYLDTRKAVDSAEFEEMKTLLGKVADFISTDMPYVDAYTYMSQSGSISEIPKEKYYNVISEYAQESIEEPTVGILDITRGLTNIFNSSLDGKTLVFIVCSKEQVKGNKLLANDVIDSLLKNQNTIVSLAANDLVVSENAYAGTITSLSNGKLFVGLENEPIEKFLYSFKEEQVYSIITANNYEPVTLKSALKENTGHNDSDTDDDGITDWDEVDTETIFEIKGLTNRSYILMDDMPTIGECLDHYGEEKFYIQSGFDRFKNDNYVSGMPTSDWETLLNSYRVTPIISDPTNEDSDRDGLLDNDYQYRENSLEIIAPIDPNPLKIDGPKGAWAAHFKFAKNEVPTELAEFYSFDVKNLEFDQLDWSKLNNLEESMEVLRKCIEKYGISIDTLFKWLSNDVNDISSEDFSAFLKENSKRTNFKYTGLFLLGFRKDNGGVCVHSQVNDEVIDLVCDEIRKKCSNELLAEVIIDAIVENEEFSSKLEWWQKGLGYTDAYDNGFGYGTNSNMAREKFLFEENGKEYILWIWRGDYLNCGPGAEMGIYTDPKMIKILDFENWSDINLTEARMPEMEWWGPIDFEIPMTLNLYNYKNPDCIESILNWCPTKPQWWITGFNPQYKGEVDVNKQVMIGSVDFSGHEEMYESFKKESNLKENEAKSEYLIFDDTNKTVWILWEAL